MTELRTEEEQLQAARDWWKENGRSLILAIGLAVAVAVSWNLWQKSRAADIEAGSIRYQNLLQAVDIAEATGKAEDLATAEHLVSELKSEHPGSAYSQYATLLMSGVYGASGDLDKALVELDWLLTQDLSAQLSAVVKIRKARALVGQGKVNDALTVLSGEWQAGFEYLRQELMGDIYVALNDAGKARLAYQTALDTSPTTASTTLLQIKLDDLPTAEG